MRRTLLLVRSRCRQRAFVCPDRCAGARDGEALDDDQTHHHRRSSDRSGGRSARRCDGNGNRHRRARGDDRWGWISTTDEHAPRDLSPALRARGFDHARARYHGSGGGKPDCRRVVVSRTAAAQSRTTSRTVQGAAAAWRPQDHSGAAVPREELHRRPGGQKRIAARVWGCQHGDTSSASRFVAGSRARGCRRIDLRCRRRRNGSHRQDPSRRCKPGHSALSLTRSPTR